MPLRLNGGMRNGMTIMSVVVAASLAGIVALAIGRLIGGQAQTMTAIKLQEQRTTLLKHYKNIVVSGWDSTRTNCQGLNGVICDRRGQVIIPTANGSALFLGRNLYEYGYTGGTAQRWWKVSVYKDDTLLSGSVRKSDSYAAPESLVAVKVKVEFLHKEHPTVTTRLADREEIVFLHHNTGSAIGSNDTNCAADSRGSVHHLTQKDSSGSALYHGAGGMVQYDLNSNYAKCSQVPLVNAEACTGSGALLGFFTYSTGAPGQQLMTGTPICSTKHHDTTPAGFDSAGISGGTEKRTVTAIDCSGSGYVKRIKNNEEPVCVSSPGGVPSKVAAEHKSWREWRAEAVETKTYTVRHRINEGRNYPADYPEVTCEVTRYKAIKSFSSTGAPEYLDYHDPSSGPQGPPGPSGEAGEHNGPRGPPGMCGRPYCCQSVYNTTTRDCGWSYQNGRWVRTRRSDCRIYPAIRRQSCR